MKTNPEIKVVFHYNIVTFVCIFYHDVAALKYDRHLHFCAQGLVQPSFLYLFIYLFICLFIYL